MWRPNNWETTLREILDAFNITYMNSDEGKLVEAGADAMLEVLTKRGYIRGESLRNIKGATGWASISPKSKWYHIPDEEQDGNC